MYRRYGWLKLHKNISAVHNLTRKAEYDTAVCLPQEGHSCLIVSNVKSYVYKYLTYRLVSEGSGGGNPTPET